MGSNHILRGCQTGHTAFGACYDPYQMRQAYNIAPLISQGYDGTGKTIIILDAFSNPYLVNDVNFFDTYFGLPAINLTIIHPGGGVPPVNAGGWAEEEQLDVDYAHAIAPGAHILLVEAQDNSDAALQSALKYAVDNNMGDVISQSFGENDTCLDPATKAAWHDTYAEAISKGMTVFASSGDQGAAQQTCDGNSWTQVTSSPASDPLVTAVGGTELLATGWPSSCFPNVDSSDCLVTTTPGTYQSESGWNEGPTGDFGNVFANTEASGGGFSTAWSEPAYQQGTIHGGKHRAVPDVAYNGAILHGVLVYLSWAGGWFRFGGTSCGSPQWAAITAIADQKAGHDYGFINSALYKIGQSSGSYASSFHDITSGNNSALEFDSNNQPVHVDGYNAGAGWDPVTGLGSPNVASLLDQLAQKWSPGQGNAAINNSKHG
jgi:subtilase family serine protease